MSKNEKMERENSKLQRKNNKLTEVNKKGGKDKERPLSEGGKSNDISKTFPNFSALTETERLIFFQTLTTARQNVEKRGVPVRHCFGTVHDEYFKYFAQDQKEEKEVLENAKATLCLASNTNVQDSNKSSCVNKSASKVNLRDFSGGKSRSPTSKIKVTSWKCNKKPMTNKPGPWDHGESIIQKDTREMIDPYLKKERSASKSNSVQLINEKLIKNVKKKTLELYVKKKAEGERKKAENMRARTPAKTSPKVRNTSKFDALNAEEKEIFFRTLQKAHDNVPEKNPKIEGEIPPMSAIVERYLENRRLTAVSTTSQIPCQREDQNKNLKVKVTLVLEDNERLSKTKSQVLSDPVREVSDRRHKFIESLCVEGKELHGTDKTHKKADESGSAFCKIGKASKNSLEINKKNSSKLNSRKETAELKKVKEKEKHWEEFVKSETKEKKKVKRKDKKLKTAPKPTYELKSTNRLKVSHLDLPGTADTKKTIKGFKKECKGQNKKHSKSKIQEITKEKVEKKVQKKKDLLKEDFSLKSENLQSRKNVYHENTEEYCRSTLIKEQCAMKAEKCQVVKEMNENCEKEIFEIQASSADINDSEENCEGICGNCGNEQNGKTVKEIVHEEEKREVECSKECERIKEEETSEQNEEKTLEVVLGSLRSGTTQEAALSDFNLSTKEESTTSVKSLDVLDDDRYCCGEAEGIKTPPESDQENQEPLIVQSQKEITAVASVLKENIKEASFVEEKPRKEKETKEIVLDCAPDKAVFNIVEKMKKLIFCLEAKVQKDDHLERKYLQLLSDNADYLSKVLESLVVRKEKQQKQVQETYTAVEILLKFDGTSAPNQKKENTPLSGKDFIPHLVSDQDLRRMHSASSTVETEAKKPNEKDFNEKSFEGVPMATNTETEVLFSPINIGDKKVLTTNIRLLQGLLFQRTELVKECNAELNILYHPETENFVPNEKSPTVEFLTDEDKENVQQNHKKKFFKSLLKFCTCGKKKTEDDIFKNLKGNAVKADVYDGKKDDPTSATLNQSTMEVLKGDERKKIITKIRRKIL